MHDGRLNARRRRSTAAAGGLIAVLIAACVLALLIGAKADVPKSVRVHTLKAYRKNWRDVSIAYPDFVGGSPVERYASELAKRNARKSYDWTMRELRTAREWPPHQPFTPYLDSEPHVTLDLPDLASWYSEEQFFFGGAHPNSTLRPLTVGLIAGKPAEIKLRDVLLPGVKPDSVMDNRVVPLVNGQKEPGYWTISEIDPRLYDKFVVTKDGLTWVFSPYDVGAYVEGPFIIDVPWSWLEGYIAPNGPLKPVLSIRAHTR